ncbi:hypothetical protein [Erythrobacter sp. MTPC3]|uniref:hypothetical protein n=1 Tax=Erythrobacter sp. MTPC3 TaxID=3056564 RepID=UPI0036F2C139
MRNIRARLAENAQAKAQAQAEAEAHGASAETSDTETNAAIRTEPAAAKAAHPRATRVGKAPLVAHPAFIPMLTVWGALLCGLSAIVAPPWLAERFTAITGLGTAAGYGAAVFAGLAALIGGTIAFCAAMLVKRATIDAHSNGAVARMATTLVRPIDPATELGSDSLDAPIEDRADLTDGPSIPDAGEMPAEGGSNLPRDLSLGEFAELKGRNAVWVEETEDEAFDHGVSVTADDLTADFSDSQPEIAAPEEIETPPVMPAAVAKLRKVPPQDLSLIQMVERFAVALHERQEAEQMDKGAHTADTRDAQLAQALKALSTFTQDDPAAPGIASARPHSVMEELQDTNRELREALTKLQGLSGAA